MAPRIAKPSFPSRFTASSMSARSCTEVPTHTRTHTRTAKHITSHHTAQHSTHAHDVSNHVRFRVPPFGMRPMLASSPSSHFSFLAMLFSTCLSHALWLCSMHLSLPCPGPLDGSLARHACVDVYMHTRCHSALYALCGVGKSNLQCTFVSGFQLQQPFCVTLCAPVVTQLQQTLKSHAQKKKKDSKKKNHPSLQAERRE